MNREVQQYLWLFCANEQNCWADWLGLAQFAINNRQHSATKFSPFQLTHTYTPCMGVEQCVTKAPAVTEFTDRLSRAYNNLVKAHSHILTQTNHSCSDTPSYATGDCVWLSTDNLHLPCTPRKLSERWLGPYSITKLVGTNAIELRLPCSMCIHPVINISRVKPYRDRLPGQPVSASGPSTVTEDCEEEYEVEFVVDSQYKGKRLEYLVHWKGWSDTDCTGSRFPTWETLRLLFATSTPLILLPHVVFAAFLLLISCNSFTMSGHRLLSLCSRHLIAWKLILRRGAVLHMLHPPWYSFSFFSLHHSLLRFS